MYVIHQDFVECLKVNRCPFDPTTLFGTLGFIGPAYAGTCVETYCKVEYQELNCCQNDIFESEYSRTFFIFYH